MYEFDVKKKWERLQKRISLFRHIPFVDFVIIAGSMAMETAREESDFDVIIGVRCGHMFTARFCAVVLFELFGWRRGKCEQNEKDKICMSHFVTSARYCLQPPYNPYWDVLYLSLVPIWGDIYLIDKFFEANNTWLSKQRRYGTKEHQRNKRYVAKSPSIWAKQGEKILSTSIGYAIEKGCKRLQMGRIQICIEEGYKPRIVVTDDELEFHPDTRRIDEMVNIGKYR
ncbi:MAG: hypothetical protein V1652_02460 [bacterium]